MPSKSPEDSHIAKDSLADLDDMGHNEIFIIFKSDQESPLRALGEKVSDMRIEKTLVEYASVDSSESNGVIEGVSRRSRFRSEH